MSLSHPYPLRLATLLSAPTAEIDDDDDDDEDEVEDDDDDDDDATELSTQLLTVLQVSLKAVLLS